MRLWSLHPECLDARGLTALWREGLLARAVLSGRTRGYAHHPQLERFCEQPDPLRALDAYLTCVLEEAIARGYAFDGTKIERRRLRTKLEVTAGQLEHEREHLRAKLRRRDPARARALARGAARVHPCFAVIEGPIAPWERRPA